MTQIEFKMNRIRKDKKWFSMLTKVPICSEGNSREPSSSNKASKYIRKKSRVTGKSQQTFNHSGRFLTLFSLKLTNHTDLKK